MYWFSSLRQQLTKWYLQYCNIMFIWSFLAKSKGFPSIISTCHNYGTFRRISYINENEIVKVFLPFEFDKAVDMVSLEAELVMEDGESIDITQEPGIPYLCAAKQYSAHAKEIVITNVANGMKHSYVIAPMFAIEVYGSE